MSARTPQQIIGADALTQLIFEGYEVVPARRSSDEQAEVVGWVSPEIIAAFAANPWINGMIWSSNRGRESSIPLYASPPAVAKGGVTDALNAAREWINAADHDEHCFTNDPNPDACRCVCDKDSVIALIDDVTAALAVGDEGIREGTSGQA